MIVQREATAVVRKVHPGNTAPQSADGSVDQYQPRSIGRSGCVVTTARLLRGISGISAQAKTAPEISENPDRTFAWCSEARSAESRNNCCQHGEHSAVEHRAIDYV